MERGGLLDDVSSYLRSGDLDLDDGERVDSGYSPYWCGIDCTSCEEHIDYDTEVIVILGVQAQYIVLPDEVTGKPKGRVEFYPVLDEDGDFARDPIILHFECWDDICEEYHELIADEPKLRSRSPATDICRCSFCHAGIGPFVEFARVMLGEITVSERRSLAAFVEVDGASPEPVCVDCIERIDDQCIKLWKETHE